MFREADSGFVRWACTRAVAWDGLDHHADWCSIHGDRDPILPSIHKKFITSSLAAGI